AQRWLCQLTRELLCGVSVGWYGVPIKVADSRVKLGWSIERFFSKDQPSLVFRMRALRTRGYYFLTSIWSRTLVILPRSSSEIGAEPALSAADCWPSSLTTKFSQALTRSTFFWLSLLEQTLWWATRRVWYA